MVVEPDPLEPRGEAGERRGRAVVSSTVRRRQLGLRLRELRQQRGMTAEEVAGELLVSTAKVTRMETGARGVNLRDVRDLCALYGVEDSEREHLMALARDSKERSWWQQYDLPFSSYSGLWNRLYVGLEESATNISDYHSSVVHGLLQTEDYVRAITEGSLPDATEQLVEEQVKTRLTRQKILDRARPPRLWVVMDEAVLHRVVGGPAVMKAQIESLVELANRPNITIQLITFGAGAHLGMDSNFTILQGDDPPWEVIYVEGLAGQQYLESPSDLGRYKQIFDHLRAIALGPKDSVRKAAEIAASYAP
ncbi:helix-turn-helix domain-containing protein [Frankia sp. AgB1.9]|uniref:helix-turn-helix domain-containing protein n=1 Tax=unclassified Frankia TaxID=2632575 RepID=UPI0019348C68|nr:MULTISPECIES: helix-turn-helix transcriptional regulator [unclassified Frankia]MBL7491947.1 helix-turn-helix domain-containing protein [Frankia sp. AgW1.1]MBL7546962.1 helix-turn-helix domain-containing protein [Frankia sp. AgB1.9]MBL7620605.1 helix-turn-helix domain-containing protein [Frankia sp. AgB1.8]